MAHKIINLVENIPSTILNYVPFVSPVVKSTVLENIQSLKETIDDQIMKEMKPTQVIIIVVLTYFLLCFAQYIFDGLKDLTFEKIKSNAFKIAKKYIPAVKNQI